MNEVLSHKVNPYSKLQVALPPTLLMFVALKEKQQENITSALQLCFIASQNDSKYFLRLQAGSLQATMSLHTWFGCPAYFENCFELVANFKNMELSSLKICNFPPLPPPQFRLSKVLEPVTPAAISLQKVCSAHSPHIAILHSGFLTGPSRVYITELYLLWVAFRSVPVHPFCLSQNPSNELNPLITWPGLISDSPCTGLQHKENDLTTLGLDLVSKCQAGLLVKSSYSSHQGGGVVGQGKSWDQGPTCVAVHVKSTGKSKDLNISWLLTCWAEYFPQLSVPHLQKLLITLQRAVTWMKFKSVY